MSIKVEINSKKLIKKFPPPLKKKLYEIIRNYTKIIQKLYEIIRKCIKKLYKNYTKIIRNYTKNIQNYMYLKNKILYIIIWYITSVLDVDIVVYIAIV